MARQDRNWPPGQRDGWRWWLTVVVVGTAMVAAVTAGGLALGRDRLDALGLGVSFTLAPIVISVVLGRRQRRERERTVVGHLSPLRQEAALTAYSGLRRTDDPAVAHDAVGLILAVNGDVLGSSHVVGVVAIGLGAGLAVLAAVSSAWWLVDAAAFAALGVFLIRQTRRLRARLSALRSIAKQSTS